MNKIDQPPPPTWYFYPDYVERYCFLKNAFSKEECEMIVSSVKGKYNLWEGQIGLNLQNNKTIRDSKIIFITPDAELRWLYEKLTGLIISLNDEFFKFDLHGFTEGLQFTEYVAPSGHYATHNDRTFGSYTIRKLSMVLQLTDETTYEGGDLELMDQGIPDKLNREQGTLLLFPSYTTHRVTPVTSGLRNSLVGWIGGPNFK
jgi:PKHD-type hydroxylase